MWRLKAVKASHDLNVKRLNKNTMKKIAALLVSVLIMENNTLLSQSNAGKEEATYKNPLPVSLGDPFVLYVKGDKYYMYGTGGVTHGFAAYSSPDLVHWKAEGQVWFANGKNAWSDSTAGWDGAYWAPEVYEVKGKFYMLYSAQWKVNPAKEFENFRIGIAVADKPTGPFIDVVDKPIFDPGYPIIDGNVFFDEDGRLYLYYSRCAYKHPVKTEIADWARKKGWFNEIEESWVYGVELKKDFSGVIGEPVLLLRPPLTIKDKQAEWESRSVTTKEVNRRWTEGSVTFKKGDTYYIMYSANYFGGKNYAVGYATSKDPLGPFEKSADNPVLARNVEKGGIVTGTGHNSITYSPDGKEMFCVYHGRTNATGEDRVVFIDRMKILQDGRLLVEGPTTEPQPLPSGIEKTNKN
jgi:beta-xylosidase